MTFSPLRKCFDFLTQGPFEKRCIQDEVISLSVRRRRRSENFLIDRHSKLIRAHDLNAAQVQKTPGQ